MSNIPVIHLIKRLVVIDDEPMYLELLKEFSIIMNLDFEGFIQTDQLNTAQLSETDLILIDIYLPGDDGLELLLQLSKNKFQGSVAVISGARESVIDSVVNLVKSLDLNFVGKLQKPFKMNELLELLSRSSDHKASASMSAEVARLFSNKFDKTSLDDWFNQRYIYPVYQPQVNCQTFEVIGFECLTRIEHPDIGLISPASFIQLLESSDMISEFTLKLFKTALAEIKSLLTQFKSLTCSFNLSARSLDIIFVQALLETVNQASVEPRQLVLELTESSAVSMTVEAMYAVSKLKVAGFSLGIDDFGTGYSSIRQLVELPFDELKIDRSFIAELDSSKASQEIVRVTIDLANSLEYRLVIEGVECESQLERIVKNGEFVVQGYYFSKPLKIEELNGFVLSKNMASKARKKQ